MIANSKKSAADALKVLTANRLGDGIAVWLGRDRTWVEQVEDAWATSSPEDVATLEALAADVIKAERHNDVTLIDVEETPSGPRPLKLRELIRARGPTIRLDLGKQAVMPAPSA
jgi:hypothetical protein